MRPNLLIAHFAAEHLPGQEEVPLQLHMHLWDCMSLHRFRESVPRGFMED